MVVATSVSMGVAGLCWGCIRGVAPAIAKRTPGAFGALLCRVGELVEQRAHELCRQIAEYQVQPNFSGRGA